MQTLEDVGANKSKYNYGDVVVFYCIKGYDDLSATVGYNRKPITFVNGKKYTAKFSNKGFIFGGIVLNEKNFLDEATYISQNLEQIATQIKI